MAFDAGMLACVLHELNQNATGARVEKVCQPGRDEILLQIRCLTGGQRILINAGANHPRIGFTAASEIDLWHIFPEVVQSVFSANVVAVVFVVSIVLNLVLPKDMEIRK